MKHTLTFLVIACLLAAMTARLSAQCASGTVTAAHASATYNALHDPDGDGYITESGGAFTSGTTERDEFELLPNSTTGWVKLFDVSETTGDIQTGAQCGNPDLVPDDDGGDFAFYNIVDPTPLQPANGDAYIMLRFRLAQAPNGNFSYNFLIDTDLRYGAGIDPNATCGNQGFEREVQYANAGGKKGLSVFDVDGSAALGTATCSQCVPVTDVQRACAGTSGPCGTTSPTFLTLPVLLSYVGLTSDVDPTQLYIAVATASSGNGNSALGGGNVADLGALNVENTGCTSCNTQSGCALFDCRLDCVNAAFVSASLPVGFLSFEVRGEANNAVHLRWMTGTEEDNSHFTVEYSRNGGHHFAAIGQLPGAGNSTVAQVYDFIHKDVPAGVGYYRIRQTDFDGTFTYSELRTVNLPRPPAPTLSVYPNPATAAPTLNLTGFDHTQEVLLTVSDLLGRTVARSSLVPQDAAGFLSNQPLLAGTYFLRAEQGERIGMTTFQQR